MSSPASFHSVIEPLLGRPYRRGAKGPDAFDCWSLVQHLQRELAGREVMSAPDVPPEKVRSLKDYVAAHPARSQWKRVPRPVHLCVIEMAHHINPFHVGVYLETERGLVVHCTPGIGVTIDPLLVLRAAGWRQFYFNDWNG